MEEKFDNAGFVLAEFGHPFSKDFAVTTDSNRFRCFERDHDTSLHRSREHLTGSAHRTTPRVTQSASSTSESDGWPSTSSTSSARPL